MSKGSIHCKLSACPRSLNLFDIRGAYLMELRLPTVVAFLWVVVALARPNTDLSIGASDTKHATKDSSRMKDGIVLDDKHAKTVQPPEAPE